MTRRRLALIGAGHAHLYLLHQADRLRTARLDVTLIAPSSFHYSGLASGVLSGALQAGEAEIDVAALAASCGVRHLSVPAIKIDRVGRILTLADGTVEPFDLLSLNIGSTVSDPQGLSAQPDVWPVKPLSNLFALRNQLEAGITENKPKPRIVIAGGGHSALEIAASLCGLFERRGLRPDLTVMSPSFGNSLPTAARKRLLAMLKARGVSFHIGTVTGRGPSTSHLADGSSFPCDHLVLATGLVAPALIADLGLPVDADGRLTVTETLQSVGDPAIFAVGDCAVITTHPRPAVGIFGVRAGPVLLVNLVAMGNGQPLKTYQPQHRWLAIMDLGNGSALAHRGRFWWTGRTSLRLKRYLDLGFVRRMRAPPPPQENRHDNL